LSTVYSTGVFYDFFVKDAEVEIDRHIDIDKMN